MVGGVWSGAEFAMDLALVGVGKERLEQGVCGLQSADGIGCEDGREALLPVVVAAFDFAFCLGSGSVAEGDAVKLEGSAELSESVRRVGEKERVIIDVKSQRQTVREKSRGEEIQMSGQRLGAVKTSASIEACGIVENVEEHLFVLAAWKESVRRRIVLPKRAEITDLPAANWFCGCFKTRVRSEVVSDGPTANRGAVRREIEPSREFAGDGAVRRPGRRTQQSRSQSHRIVGPSRAVIAARKPRLPKVRRTRSASAEVVRAELIDPRATHAEFGGESRHVDLTGAKP